jgi:hypothetical protein
VWVLVRLGRTAPDTTGETDAGFDVEADPTPRS